QAPRVADELGDVLFAAVNVARHAGVDPELALRSTTERFLERFQWVRNTLRERGVELGRDQVDLATLDALWDEAKRTLDPAG
ncbi:MAG: nucleoside triphosphate pyrophosphohydrolase, partial [Myxococcota bacterium]|nr:nucleoside triphosphate pyrophosphohydrolase [Myxococcota bacterium]